MNKELSKRGQAVRGTRKRRRSGKKTAAGRAKSGVMTSKEFRKLMDGIGQVINGAIGNLVGELEHLNQGEDLDGAAQLICRSATLFVVAQVFDVLHGAVTGKRRIHLDRLAKISRIVVEQRREERQAQKPGGERRASTSGQAQPLPDPDQLDDLVREIYGAKLPRSAKPLDDHPPEALDAPSIPNAEESLPTPSPAGT